MGLLRISLPPQGMVWVGYACAHADGTGGFVTYLPQDAANASALISALQSNLWIDRGTRLVAITFNLYNTNSKQLTVVRLTVEVFMTSEVVVNREIYSMRLVVYASYIDQVRDS